MPKNTDLIPTKAFIEVSLGENSTTALAKACEASGGFPKLTIGDVKAQFVTLKEAKKRLGFAHLMYPRQLVRKGDLEGIKVLVSNSPRWLVTIESIEGYKTRQVRRGSQRNYTLRIDPEQEAKVRQLLKQNGVEYQLDLTYVKKGDKDKPEDIGWASVIEELD